MTLSGIASLIVEYFLPDAHRNYILSNVQVSEWYRKYKDSVPSFLHGRPRNVVLHCLDRQAKGRKYDKADITMLEEEGCFAVNKSSGGTHRVEFGSNTDSAARIGYVGIFPINICLGSLLTTMNGAGTPFQRHA